MNTFKINGTNIELRLTLSGQLALKKKYSENVLSTIFRGIDDPEVFLDILTQSLTFRGNENQITDPMVAYDMIVDAGFCGAAGMSEILAGVAHVSGLIDDAQREKVVEFAKGAAAEIFDDDADNASSEDGTSKNA